MGCVRRADIAAFGLASDQRERCRKVLAAGIENMPRSETRMLRRILVGLAIVFCLAPRLGHAVPIVTAGSGPVPIFKNVGDIFTIPISITDAVDLTSFQFDLSCNAGTDFLVVDGSVIVGPQGAPVPEPSTLSLLGVWLAAWGMYGAALRRRRQRGVQALRRVDLPHLDPADALRQVAYAAEPRDTVSSPS